MNYQDALDYIHNTRKFGMKLGLDNIGFLLDICGNPQDSLKYIHVAGTNGKGSFCAYMTQILIRAGLKVGTFTSPYLQRFNERIRLNNIEIPDSDLVKHTQFIKDKIEYMTGLGMHHPTEFEIITSIMFNYFKEEKVDIVVLEVGLGGRYDSTNIIKAPEICVITSLSLDHTEILGKTYKEIAYEKSGIIKPGAAVVVYPQNDEALNVIKESCRQNQVEIRLLSADDFSVKSFEVERTVFNYRDFQRLEISLTGEHQVYNASLVVLAVEELIKRGWKISKNSIYEGLSAAKWPGRLELMQKKPYFFIDGAHNESAAKTLADSIKLLFGDKKVIFIFGVMKDKDYEKMIKEVAEIAQAFIIIKPDTDRALGLEVLEATVSKYCNNVIYGGTIVKAIEAAFELSDENSIICAFGSLFYIGFVRDYFEGKRKLN